MLGYLQSWMETSWCIWWNRGKRETQLGAIGRVIRLNRIIIIIAGGAQKRTAMNTEGGNGIIKDSQNGIALVTRSERTRKAVVQVARELCPMGAANGASDTTVADIGRDAGKMECMKALGSEYSLARTAALAVVTQRI